MLSYAPWLLILPLLVAIYSLSFQASRDVEDSAIHPLFHTIYRWFHAISLTLSFTTLAMVALLTFRIFTPLLLGFTLSSFAIATIVVNRNLILIDLNDRLKHRELKNAGFSLRKIFPLLLIVAIALLFRIRPSSLLIGGQDPGVYANTGNYIAQHGTHFYTDTTLPIVKEDPKLLSYYLNATYYRATQHKNGEWFGNLTPGTYIHDLDKGEHVAQFYPATHSWLALGNLLFGQYRSTWIFLPFSLMSVIAVGIIVTLLTKRWVPGLIASTLLAINPGHAAISGAPLSETIAGFFFLSGLVGLINCTTGGDKKLSSSSLTLSSLAFGSLFFTRITGFVTTPLILAALIPMANIYREKFPRIQLALYGVSCALFYLLSFYWGLFFTSNYSLDIYRGKLKLSSEMLDFFPYIFGSCMVGWTVLMILLPRLTWIKNFLRRNALKVSILVMTTAVILIIFQSYKLCFTDHYTNHKWFGKRWRMAGLGLNSIPYLSISVLLLIASPLPFVAGLFGIGYSFKKAFSMSRWIPICIMSFIFFLALTVKQLTVPYMYYFARYQLSEILPLLLIVGTCFVDHVLKRVSLRGRSICWAGYLLTVIIFHTEPALARLKETEGLLFSRALSCVDDLSAGNTIIAIDKSRFTESLFVLPLRLTYNKKMIAFRKKDLPTVDEQREFFEFFTDRGYSILLLTTIDSWSSSPLFKRVTGFTAKIRKFGGSKGKLRLPYRYSDGAAPLLIYRYMPLSEPSVKSITEKENRSPLPATCAGLQ